MSKSIKTLSLLWVIIALSACSKGSLLPKSTGTPGEIVVVVEKSVWNSPSGVTLKDILLSDMEGLPQSEPNFRLSVVTPTQFDNILKPVRNILIVKIDSTYTQPRFSYEVDVWAQSQLVLYIKAPNASSIKPFVEQNAATIIRFFVNGELGRTVEFLKKNYNTDANAKLLDQLNIDMKVPAELKFIKQGKDFFWISNDQARGRMDIVAYSTPYYSSQQLTLAGIIATRDSVMKANIPGGLPYSFMTTQRTIDPIYKERNIGGKFAAEVRGLWEVKGDIMGGPFVSITRIDQANNRVITVEAFVYAPERKKAQLMRRNEASLFTLRLPKEIELPEITITPEIASEKEK